MGSEKQSHNRTLCAITKAEKSNTKQIENPLKSRNYHQADNT